MIPVKFSDVTQFDLYTTGPETLVSVQQAVSQTAAIETANNTTEQLLIPEIPNIIALEENIGDEFDTNTLIRNIERSMDVLAQSLL